MYAIYKQTRALCVLQYSDFLCHHLIYTKLTLCTSLSEDLILPDLALDDWSYSFSLSFVSVNESFFD